MYLLLNGCPAIRRRYARIGCHKIDSIHCSIISYFMPFKEFKDRRPVNAFATKPVASSRLLMIAHVSMEFTQYLSHLPCIVDRYRRVGIAMMNIYAKWFVITYQFQYITLVAGTKE